MNKIQLFSQIFLNECNSIDLSVPISNTSDLLIWYIYSFYLMFLPVCPVRPLRGQTHPFVGQYVDKEAVSTPQVHERLPGSEAIPCTLLSPQHLQSSSTNSSFVFRGLSIMSLNLANTCRSRHQSIPRRQSRVSNRLTHFAAVTRISTTHRSMNSLRLNHDWIYQEIRRYGNVFVHKLLRIRHLWPNL